MRLSLVSTHPRLGDKPANVEAMVERVRSARGDIVVFPEMATTGYVVRDRVHALAEPVDGPTKARMAQVAAETGRWVLYGFPRASERRRGVVHNSAALVDPEGGVQIYDKRYLATFGPFEDGLYFAPGDESGLMETPWGRIGLSICYDLFFPELHKAMVLQGADLLLNISASPLTSRRFFEALFPARAIESAVPVAYTNFAGAQDNLVFWGGAQLWGARGTEKAKGAYFEEGVLEVEVDHEETRTARPLRPTLRDTRRDILQELADSL